MKDHQEKTSATKQSQKTYKTPSLKEYGNIRELTAAAGSRGSKGGTSAEDSNSSGGWRS